MLKPLFLRIVSVSPVSLCDRQPPKRNPIAPYIPVLPLPLQA
ncbi:MAG: hypothetical protein AAFY30_07825 [Cyanobacteria bacterium J06642_12]